MGGGSTCVGGGSTGVSVRVVVDLTQRTLITRPNCADNTPLSGYPVSTLKEVVKRSKVKIDSILSYSRNNLHDNTLESFIPFFR